MPECTIGKRASAGKGIAALGFAVLVSMMIISFAPANGAIAEGGALLSKVYDAVTAQLHMSVDYPTGWLIENAGGIPAGESVQVLHAPGVAITPHQDGKTCSAAFAKRDAASWPSIDDGQVLVKYGERIIAVNPDLLFLNLPDFVPGAVYDIVYTYGATGRCGGLEIPGVTGQRIPGYADGMQRSAYWNALRYAVPCAYRTAVKLMGVEEDLEHQGYRLLVYDVYRPLSAQYYLSDKFVQAYDENPEMKEALGDWSLDWFVASGPSGHSFGTDLDVSVCTMAGEPYPMPSLFDAFDQTGSLCVSPMSREAIATDTYREIILDNAACMDMHRTFKEAGFSELASEWWHFGDEETQAIVQGIVGLDALDFEALL